MLPLLLQLFLALHPIHIGVIELEYNNSSKQFESTIRLFIDDFEADVKKQYQVDLLIGSKHQHPKADSVIKVYIAKHFQIEGVKKLSLVGYEYNHETIELFVQSEKLKAPKQVSIQANFMFDQFNDQINIVHFTNGRHKKSVIQKVAGKPLSLQ